MLTSFDSRAKPPVFRIFRLANSLWMMRTEKDVLIQTSGKVIRFWVAAHVICIRSHFTFCTPAIFFFSFSLPHALNPSNVVKTHKLIRRLFFFQSFLTFPLTINSRRLCNLILRKFTFSSPNKRQSLLASKVSATPCCHFLLNWHRLKENSNHVYFTTKMFNQTIKVC